MDQLGKYLAEALKASMEHIPNELRKKCLVIGGAALQLLGSKRSTRDLDFAASEEAQSEFLHSIKTDKRFVQGGFKDITFNCVLNQPAVEIEFVTPGEGDIPTITGQFKVLSDPTVYAPTADQLLVMKAACIRLWDEDSDIEDLRFLIDYLTKGKKFFEGFPENGHMVKETIGKLDELHKERLNGLLAEVRSRVLAIKSVIANRDM